MQTKNNINLLKDLLAVNTQSVRQYIINNYKPDIVAPEFLYLDGNKNVVNAHYDIAHSEPENKKVYFDHTARVLWSPNGLGADDRAGVFLALWLHLKTGCSVIFTDLEETGGLGGVAATESTILNAKMEDKNFIIGLDRRGCGNYVLYNRENQRFKHIIESAGFKKEIGSFSDVQTLCEHWLIAGVNVAVGYYHQHTDRELLKLNELELTASMLAPILEKQYKEPFKIKAKYQCHSAFKTKYKSKKPRWLLEDDYNCFLTKAYCEECAAFGINHYNTTTGLFLCDSCTTKYSVVCENCFSNVPITSRDEDIICRECGHTINEVI